MSGIYRLVMRSIKLSSLPGREFGDPSFHFSLFLRREIALNTQLTSVFNIVRENYLNDKYNQYTLVKMFKRFMVNLFFLTKFFTKYLRCVILLFNSRF